jgi:hypothetical protein
MGLKYKESQWAKPKSNWAHGVAGQPSKGGRLTYKWGQMWGNFTGMLLTAWGATFRWSEGVA